MPVQWGTNPAVSQSVFLLRGLHAARPAAAPANQDYYYLETDTGGGTLFQSTGAAWVQVAGPVTDVDTATFAALTDVDTTGQVDQQPFMWDATASKYLPMPGVVGDGASGLDIVGGVSAGDFSYATEPNLEFAGRIQLFAGDATLNGSSLQLSEQLRGILSDDRSAGMQQLFRFINRNGHTVSDPVVAIFNADASGGTHPVPASEPVFRVHGTGAKGTVEVNDAGGVGVFSTAPPTVQPTGGAATAGAAYTATEQTMLQAAYDSLRAFGLLS